MSTVDGGENSYYYFGLVGLASLIDVASYGSREFAYFERVPEAPAGSVIHRAVNDQDVANTLVLYAPHVSFQLAVSADLGIGSVVALALRIVNALRIKTRAELLVPAYLSVSWNDLGRSLPGSCDGKILEDIPSAMMFDEPRNVEQEDFDWLWMSGDVFEELLKDSRFSLAVESLCYCHLLRDARMMVAALWAGIEALCGVREELRFRISLIAASALEPRGLRRAELYKKVQKLYDLRSKAVHGAEVSTDALFEHVVEVKILLAQLLMKAVAGGKVYTKEEYEALLLV